MEKNGVQKHKFSGRPPKDPLHVAKIGRSNAERNLIQKPSMQGRPMSRKVIPIRHKDLLSCNLARRRDRQANAPPNKSITLKKI